MSYTVWISKGFEYQGYFLHLFSSGQDNDDSLKTLITEDEPFKKHMSMISLEK